MEAGALHGLPAQVFVRGFIRSYAKVVGIGESEPLTLYDRALNRETEEARAKSASPVVDPVLAGGTVDEDDGLRRRRGLGLAVFVVILVLIATITLSLLLAPPAPVGRRAGFDARPRRPSRSPPLPSAR